MIHNPRLLTTNDRFVWVILDALTAAKLFYDGNTIYQVWRERGSYSEAEMGVDCEYDDYKLGHLVEEFDAIIDNGSYMAMELDDYLKLISYDSQKYFEIL